VSWFVAGLAAGALLLSACGSDSSDDATPDSSQPDATTAPAVTEDSTVPATDEPAGAGAPVVGTESTDAGEVLVDADGVSQYGFLPDVDGLPTCTDACADAWPPLIVDSADLPAGLDADVFSVVERPDGSFQLAAGDWPLYAFAADAGPGDINGQGSGDVWFLAAPDGSLIKGEDGPSDMADTESMADTASSGY
jgi:predicted lipoprotein with Yx(FWY)xxD motif